MSILQALYKIISKTDINSGKNIELLESDRNSILYENNNKFYLISVCHYIYDNTEINILLKEHRLKIDKSNILCIPELDIMIIDVTSYKYFNDKYKIDLTKINYKVNHINSNTQLFVIDSVSQVQPTKIMNMQMHETNKLYPVLLKYYAEKPCHNLEGYSGSPVYDSLNNILGIVNGYRIDSNHMIVTPLFFIKRIFNEIDKYNSFKGLCGFYQEYSILKRNLVITKKEELNHNIYIQNIQSFTYSKLLPDDIIIEVDNIPVDIKGYIYCDLIGMNIELYSYINLTKTVNDNTKFKIIRNKNKLYKNIIVTLGNRDYHSSLSTCIKINSLNTIWQDNKLYIKINSSLWDYIKLFKYTENNRHLFDIFQMKYRNKVENNYLLVEDIVLKKNIFTNNISNSVILKQF